jgi:hypothetical protein
MTFSTYLMAPGTDMDIEFDTTLLCPVDQSVPNLWAHLIQQNASCLHLMVKEIQPSKRCDFKAS